MEEKEVEFDCALQLGDKITGTKTGTLAPSTVVGIMTAEAYIGIMGHPAQSKWDVLYPSWQEKPVVLSLFDSPQRNVSFEEFKENLITTNPSIANISAAAPEESEVLFREEYERLPAISLVAYPMQDVCLL